MAAPGASWERVMGRLRLVSLSHVVQLLVPLILVPTLSRSTRGISFHPGRSGFLLGSLVVAGSLAVGWLLRGTSGILGAAALFWLFGTAGLVMTLSSVHPLAFVKPICLNCRLLPVIVEHEAIHLAGVAQEQKVWASMRLRHSAESLKLEGDPAICWFCPIAKRLKEH